jgi:hypothetical protein
VQLAAQLHTVQSPLEPAFLTDAMVAERLPNVKKQTSALEKLSLGKEGHASLPFSATLSTESLEVADSRDVRVKKEIEKTLFGLKNEDTTKIPRKETKGRKN